MWYFLGLKENIAQNDSAEVYCLSSGIISLEKTLQRWSKIWEKCWRKDLKVLRVAPMEVSWLLRLETKGASCTISKADCFRKYSCSYSGFEPIRKFLSCKIKSALIILLATWNEMFQFISRQVDSVEGSRIVLIFSLFVNWILGANAIFNPSQNASPSAILSMYFIKVDTKMLIMSFSCETCLIISLWLPANLRHFSFLWIVNVCSVCKVFTCLPRAKVCYH